jgi:glycosyltransferase involved in cell wall biosynthesis
MIPTYNCANYLAKTLRSVLAQDPSPELMQIEVVDDYSTEDDPAAVVSQLGHGRVGFYRQPENVGHTKNFETCLKRSRGKLIHLLHGDDYVRTGFYQKMEAAFEQNPDIGAAFCRQIFMDEYGHWQDISPLEQMHSGILTNWLERLALEQRIMTPSMVVRRDVYEELGGFDSRLLCSEDWEMWVRIAAHYPIWYETEPLAVYRMHMHSNTGRHIRSGEDIRYTRHAIQIFKSYLPSQVAHEITSRARETYALSALNMTYQLLHAGDIVGVLAQVREALKCYHSVKVIRRMICVLIWGALGYIRRTKTNVYA